MVPSTCPAKQISGGQREEGHGVVHHVQGEHHQTNLFHHVLVYKFNDVLLEHGGLPHVLPLAVHLKFVWLDK